MHKNNKHTSSEHLESHNKNQTGAPIPDAEELKSSKPTVVNHGSNPLAKDKEEADKKARHKKKYVYLPEEEYESLKKEARIKEELKDTVLRLQAEFENARKRMEKERQEFIRYASEDTIKGLIGIIDDFERALSASRNAQDFNILYKGIEMILKQLEEFLSKKGLARIKTVGETFDPSRHEALEVISDDTKPENTVVEEILKGYSLNDKILRAAVVKISKKSDETKGLNRED